MCSVSHEYYHKRVKTADLGLHFLLLHKAGFRRWRHKCVGFFFNHIRSLPILLIKHTSSEVHHMIGKPKCWKHFITYVFNMHFSEIVSMEKIKRTCNIHFYLMFSICDAWKNNNANVQQNLIRGWIGHVPLLFSVIDPKSYYTFRNM